MGLKHLTRLRFVFPMTYMRRPFIKLNGLSYILGVVYFIRMFIMVTIAGSVSPTTMIYGRGCPTAY